MSAHPPGPDTARDAAPPGPPATDPAPGPRTGQADAATGPVNGGSVPLPGVTWSPNASFPRLAPFDELDVLDLSRQPQERHVTVTTLQGLVNRGRPRIYLTGDKTAAQWLPRLGVTTHVVPDDLTLIARYQSEIKGLVVFDDQQIETINLATTIAGLEGGVVVAPATASLLAAAPYSLPVLADLRENHFPSALAVDQYTFDTYASRTSTRILMGLDPAITDNLRDYIVATQAAVFWLDPRVAEEQALLDRFLRRMEPQAPYLGWWKNEQSGVSFTSKYAVPVYAADWSTNLTVFGGGPRTVRVPAVPPRPPLEAKIYVAIFMSDGDNLQEDQTLVPLKWADPNRGTVPVSWTISPALVDVAPVMIDYFWSTATENDVLVSGPSGLGYTYPKDWPVDRFAEYTKRTDAYLKRAGLRVITVWGGAWTGPQGTAYAQNMPGLLGLTDQTDGGKVSIVDGRLPVLQFATSYGDDEPRLEAGIDRMVASWTAGKPLFVAVQGNMNKSTITPTTFRSVKDHYAGNANIVFVRGDHLFQLIREANQLDVDPR
jgi:GxGYxY sequence motif in domain of unknown function N-terminal/GxGYxYP putative glycoside hydrolase C-terminal domain